MTEFDRQVEHLTRLATTPGWWQYARMRARELQTQPGFHGIADAVRERLNAAKFRPTPDEQGEWWC